MKTDADYKLLNERFDERMKSLCSQYKYSGRNLGLYKWIDILHGILELKGSEIMHDSDDLFNYKTKYNFKRAPKF